MILAESPISPLVKYRAVFCMILQDKYLLDFWAQFYTQCREWIHRNIRSRNVIVSAEIQNYIQGASAVLGSLQ